MSRRACSESATNPLPPRKRNAPASEAIQNSGRGDAQHVRVALQVNGNTVAEDTFDGERLKAGLLKA